MKIFERLKGWWYGLNADDLRSIICGLIVAIMAALFLLLLTSCTFSPVRIDGLEEECNLAYSAMRLIDGKTVDKSLAIIPIERCSAVLQRKRCKAEVYGINPVDYNDPKKYRDYSECLKEMK